MEGADNVALLQQGAVSVAHRGVPHGGAQGVGGGVQQMLHTAGVLKMQMAQQPVYYPFSEVVLDNGRRLVSSDLQQDADGRYQIDYADFEAKIVDNQVKLFLLCSPHNPVGRVWSREELLTLGRICQKHHVTVFSDEIHAYFVWQGKQQVFAAVDPAFAQFNMIATSPSKTFNIAGL